MELNFLTDEMKEAVFKQMFKEEQFAFARRMGIDPEGYDSETKWYQIGFAVGQDMSSFLGGFKDCDKWSKGRNDSHGII